ncbi:MAG: universal stress protein [Myxococcota bacterium]
MFPSDQPVVVATDLSTASEEALRQAHAWAAGRPLIAVHALADPTPIFAPIGEMQRYVEQLRQLRAKREEELREHVHATLKDAEARAEAHVGSPADVVLRVAEEQRAALVVVGATGRGSVERALLGTTADQILRSADRPVLVARPSGPGPIVAATDLSEPSAPALEAGVAASRLLARPLVALHALDIAHPVLAAFEPSLVIDVQTRQQLHAAVREVLRAGIERHGHEATSEVQEGPPARVISERAQTLGASLIVVATHGRTGVARIALGSVAADVGRGASCSVLVVRSKR